MRSRRRLGTALAVAVLAVGGLVAGIASQEAPAADPIAGLPPLTGTLSETVAPPQDIPEPEPPAPDSDIAWRSSKAVGAPWAGRLVRGVQLPAEGAHFFTWDPALDRSPNRPWRRWGTDRLLRRLLQVLDEYAATHPDAPRVGIGDLSRPEGGDFGARFGGLGHASHENGLDVDVYYPRRDGRERETRAPRHVDRRLAQALVDLFVDAGAKYVFVGFQSGLTGPADVVQAIPHHENHMHVRIFRGNGKQARERPARPD